jgi:hypothetical protein
MLVSSAHFSFLISSRSKGVQQLRNTLLSSALKSITHHSSCPAKVTVSLIVHGIHVCLTAGKVPGISVIDPYGGLNKDHGVSPQPPASAGHRPDEIID